ncbi:MAG: ABC transporter permease [Myxococcota bacterium]
MRILIAFIRKELRQIRRDKRILPILIVAPVLQLIILGYAATFDIKNINLAVYDMDRSRLSKELIDNFISSSYFLLNSYVDNQNDIDNLFKSNRINAALLIPKNFEKKMYSDREISVLFIADGTEGTTANVALFYARKIFNKFINQSSLPHIQIDYEIRVWHNPELKSSFFMIPAIFALLLSIVAMLVPSMSLVKEKETGTIEQLFVTPIKPYQIILGKMSAFMLIAILDVILVNLLSIFWFGLPFRGTVFDFAVAILLFLFSTLGVATFFSSNTNTQQQAMMSVMFLFFLPSMLLSGFIFPVENIPYPIRGISYLLPLTYFIDILRSLFLKGSSMAELSFQYKMLAIIGITIFTFSLLRFKKYND